MGGGGEGGIEGGAATVKRTFANKRYREPVARASKYSSIARKR